MGSMASYKGINGSQEAFLRQRIKNYRLRLVANYIGTGLFVSGTIYAGMLDLPVATATGTLGTIVSLLCVEEYNSKLKHEKEELDKHLKKLRED